MERVRAERLGRRGAHPVQQLGERQDPPLHQLRVADAEGRLEADDPERRIVEGGLLLVIGVRRMVRGQRVQSAVREARANRVPVVRSTMQ